MSPSRTLFVARLPAFFGSTTLRYGFFVFFGLSIFCSLFFNRENPLNFSRGLFLSSFEAITLTSLDALIGFFMVHVTFQGSARWLVPG